MMPTDETKGPEMLAAAIVGILKFAGWCVAMYCLYWIVKAIIGFIKYYSKFA